MAVFIYVFVVINVLPIDILKVGFFVEVVVDGGRDLVARILFLVVVTVAVFVSGDVI